MEKCFQDLDVRLVVRVVHRDSCPGVNKPGHRAAALQRTPPAGRTGELHLHQQPLVLQGDLNGGGAEGCGGRQRNCVRQVSETGN